MNPRITLQLSESVEQEQQIDVRAIGEGMAHLLGVQREIRALTGRPSFADEVWARIAKHGG